MFITPKTGFTWPYSKNNQNKTISGGAREGFHPRSHKEQEYEKLQFCQYSKKNRIFYWVIRIWQLQKSNFQALLIPNQKIDIFIIWH